MQNRLFCRAKQWVLECQSIAIDWLLSDKTSKLHKHPSTCTVAETIADKPQHTDSQWVQVSFQNIAKYRKVPFQQANYPLPSPERWRLGSPSTSQAAPEQSVPSVIPDHDDARKPEEVARITLHYVPVEVLHIGLIREFGLKSYLRGKRTDYLFKHSSRGTDTRKVVGDDDETVLFADAPHLVDKLKGVRGNGIGVGQRNAAKVIIGKRQLLAIDLHQRHGGSAVPVHFLLGFVEHLLGDIYARNSYVLRIHRQHKTGSYAHFKHVFGVNCLHFLDDCPTPLLEYATEKQVVERCVAFVTFDDFRLVGVILG